MKITFAEVMLYAIDQEKIASFWKVYLGFNEVGRQEYGSTYAIELMDASNNGTKLVIQNKTAVAASEPELNIGTPSILLYGDDLIILRTRLKDAGYYVGDLVEFPDGKKVFNFSDPENNYFAIKEY